MSELGHSYMRYSSRVCNPDCTFVPSCSVKFGYSVNSLGNLISRSGPRPGAIQVTVRVVDDKSVSEIGRCMVNVKYLKKEDVLNAASMRVSGNDSCILLIRKAW